MTWLEPESAAFLHHQGWTGLVEILLHRISSSWLVLLDLVIARRLLATSGHDLSQFVQGRLWDQGLCIREAVLYQIGCFLHIVKTALDPPPLGLTQSCCGFFDMNVKKFVNVCCNKISAGHVCKAKSYCHLFLFTWNILQFLPKH